MIQPMECQEEGAGSHALHTVGTAGAKAWGGKRGLVCLGGFVSFGLATLLDFHWGMVRDKA